MQVRHHGREPVRKGTVKMRTDGRATCGVTRVECQESTYVGWRVGWRRSGEQTRTSVTRYPAQTKRAWTHWK